MIPIEEDALERDLEANAVETRGDRLAPARPEPVHHEPGLTSQLRDDRIERRPLRLDGDLLGTGRDD